MLCSCESHSIKPVHCYSVSGSLLHLETPTLCNVQCHRESGSSRCGSTKKTKSKTRHVSPAMIDLRAQKEANQKALKELRKEMRRDPHYLLHIFALRWFMFE